VGGGYNIIGLALMGGGYALLFVLLACRVCCWAACS